MISKSLYLAGQETWAVPGLARSSSRSLGTGIVVLESQMLLNFSPLEGGEGQDFPGGAASCATQVGLVTSPGGCWHRTPPMGLNLPDADQAFQRISKGK